MPKPTVEAYTVGMPWYEREDCSRLWGFAHDRVQMPSDYEIWHSERGGSDECLAGVGARAGDRSHQTGRVLAWLARTGLPNTPGRANNMLNSAR